MKQEKGFDLEAVEFFIRSHMLQAGARCLQQLLETIGQGRRRDPLMCARNHLAQAMRSRGQRNKTMRTILGPVTIRRSRFVCPVCDHTRFPLDELLGVVGTRTSPGARRMMARAGAQNSFALSAEDLRLFADLRVDAKDVERVAKKVGEAVDTWMSRQGSAALLVEASKESIDTMYVSYDATGVPMRREALTASRGRSPDGKARTREAKLGCVFTQTDLDERGRPKRDSASTTYVGAIESSVDFGYRIHAEAVRRGMRSARRVAVLIDAQGYNKTIAAEHFPDATVIVDLYHAREHLAEFVRVACLMDVNSPVHQRLEDLLDAGEIETLAEQMREQLPRSGARRKDGTKQLSYFLNNIEAMRYGQFRQMGLFVGSGVIEAGCKTVIGKRLKQSGMFWSLSGANAIIALRCCLLSNRFADFWEDAA